MSLQTQPRQKRSNHYQATASEIYDILWQCFSESKEIEQVGFCQHFITRNGFIAPLTTLLLIQSRLPTLESALSSLKASYTCLSWTPPPRSRKLAGFPPWRSMMSQVAMANPAPFTAERHKGQRYALKGFNVYILKTQFVTIEHTEPKKRL